MLGVFFLVLDLLSLWAILSLLNIKKGNLKMINPHYVQLSAMQEKVEFLLSKIKSIKTKSDKAVKKKKKKLINKLKVILLEIEEDLMYEPMITEDYDARIDEVGYDDEGGDNDDWWKK